MESEELDFVQEHKKMPVTLDLTPCDDAVSRQEAIEAFQMFREYESNRSNKEWVDRIETVLNQLPPVTPSKTGQTLPDVDIKKFEQDPRYQNMVKMWGRKVAIEKYKSFVLGQ